MKNLFFLLTMGLVIVSSCSEKEPILKIGLVADPQYANKPAKGKRYYRESLWKLEEAIDTFNHYNVDFVQNLGDIIDADWESFDSILPIYDKLHPDVENYHLLGNHDFEVDSIHLTKLLEKLSMPDYYYSYTKKGWRFIVLDATDYSYYSYQLHAYDTNRVHDYAKIGKERSNNHPWNSAIGEEQQNWIKQELDSANLLNQKVILFSHLPIRPHDDLHNLWNDYEIISLIENSPNVVAFISGHNHAGAYTFENGIHYITMFGMVDTMINAYGILEFYSDRLVLKGYGNQKTLYLKSE